MSTTNIDNNNINEQQQLFNNDYMSFTNLVKKLHNDNIHPPIPILKDIVGNMLNKLDFSIIDDNVPNNDEFYNNIKQILKDLQVPTELVANTSIDTMINNIFSIMNLPHQQIIIYDTLNIQSDNDNDNDNDDDNDSGQQHGEFPLSEWYNNPDKLATDLLNSPTQANTYIQSFCTRYTYDINIINILNIVFNKISATNKLRQDINNDIISTAIKHLHIDGISRSSFKRDTHQIVDIMLLAEKHLYKTNKDEVCVVCTNDIENTIVIDNENKKEVYNAAAYVPYICKHKFCKSCFFGIQTTALGDYCPCCRSILKTE